MAVAGFALVHFEAGDLPFNGEAEAGAIAHHTGHQRLAVFSIGHLNLVNLLPIEPRHGDQTHLSVPARDDGQEVLCGHQFYVMHFLNITHANDF